MDEKIEAKIDFADGTVVTIVGRSDIVTKVIIAVKNPCVEDNVSEKRAIGFVEGKSVKPNRKGKVGPGGLIEELIFEKYFSGQKKTIEEVQKRLSEKGYPFETPYLSTPLKRVVRKGLLKREKVGSQYGYWV